MNLRPGLNREEVQAAIGALLPLEGLAFQDLLRRAQASEQILSVAQASEQILSVERSKRKRKAMCQQTEGQRRANQRKANRGRFQQRARVLWTMGKRSVGIVADMCVCVAGGRARAVGTSNAWRAGGG